MKRNELVEKRIKGNKEREEEDKKKVGMKRHTFVRKGKEKGREKGKRRGEERIKRT